MTQLSHLVNLNKEKKLRYKIILNHDCTLMASKKYVYDTYMTSFLFFNNYLFIKDYNISKNYLLVNLF